MKNRSKADNAVLWSSLLLYVLACAHYFFGSKTSAIFVIISCLVLVLVNILINLISLRTIVVDYITYFYKKEIKVGKSEVEELLKMTKEIEEELDKAREIQARNIKKSEELEAIDKKSQAKRPGRPKKSDKTSK